MQRFYWAVPRVGPDDDEQGTEIEKKQKGVWLWKSELQEVGRNDEFCIKNEEFCIKNENFVSKLMNVAGIGRRLDAFRDLGPGRYDEPDPREISVAGKDRTGRVPARFSSGYGLATEPPR